MQGGGTITKVRQKNKQGGEGNQENTGGSFLFPEGKAAENEEVSHLLPEKSGKKKKRGELCGD